MMSRWWSPAFAALLALAPLVAAATTPGLVLDGPLGVPSGASAEGRALAILVQDPESLRNVLLNAPHVSVSLHEVEVLTVGATPATPGLEVAKPRPPAATWDVHDVHMFVQPARAGFVGVYPSDLAETRVTLLANASFAAREATVFASGDVKALDDGPQRPWYYQPIVGHHVYATAPAIVDYDGPGSIKIMGSTVTIVARENTTPYETGVWQTETSVTARWIQLSFAQGALQLNSPSAPAEVALASDAHIAWSGEAKMRAVDGFLQIGDQQLHPVAGAAKIDGDLRATLGVVGTGGTSRLLLTGADGTLHGTSLAVTRANGAPLAAPTSISWLLPLLGVALVAGSAAHLVMRRAKGRALPTPVQRGAPSATDDLDWDTALARAVAAREASPHDPAAVLEHAYCLLYRGDFDAAVGAFDEAAALSTTGEPDLRAAVALAERGYQDEALGHFERALSREPALAEEALIEPGLDDMLAHNAKAKTILQQALDRMRSG